MCFWWTITTISQTLLSLSLPQHTRRNQTHYSIQTQIYPHQTPAVVAHPVVCWVRYRFPTLVGISDRITILNLILDTHTHTHKQTIVLFFFNTQTHTQTKQTRPKQILCNSSTGRIHKSPARGNHHRIQIRQLWHSQFNLFDIVIRVRTYRDWNKQCVVFASRIRVSLKLCCVRGRSPKEN